MGVGDGECRPTENQWVFIAQTDLAQTELAQAQAPAPGDGGSWPGQQGQHYEERMCDGKAEKMEEKSDVCIVERGRTED